ncbi:MAG: hypothetical protein ACP5I1_20380 [Candidatus Hinthialibacter sp.]
MNTKKGLSIQEHFSSLPDPRQAHKTVQRSFDRATGKSAIHMISAWASNGADLFNRSHKKSSVNLYGAAFIPTTCKIGSLGVKFQPLFLYKAANFRTVY